MPNEARARHHVIAVAATPDPGRSVGLALGSTLDATIRVLLGEDSYLASEGIARIIERAEDLELVATCPGLDQLRSAVESATPDVVVTDIRMPPTYSDEGIRFARELRSSRPNLGVVVLSQHSDPVYATALLEHGSERRAYLLKERVADGDTLTQVVRSVAVGGSYVDPTIVEALVRSNRLREEMHLAELTARELEILQHIAEGQSNAAIAAELFLTKRAVERHINNVFMKLDLGNAEDVSRRVKAALIYLAGGRG
jgi:DNA-binding NarL/FixJ family response regulator